LIGLEHTTDFLKGEKAASRLNSMYSSWNKACEDGLQTEIGSQGSFLYKTCQVFWNKEYKRLPTVVKIIANEK